MQGQQHTPLLTQASADVRTALLHSIRSDEFSFCWDPVGPVVADPVRQDNDKRNNIQTLKTVTSLNKESRLLLSFFPKRY